MKVLFVGERRSATAVRMGVTWKDGRLAGKQLFDALRANGINPESCDFANWFERGNRKAIRQHPGPRIALGSKVQKAMRLAGVDHVSMIHPAARGRIRLKAAYAKHVEECMRLAGVL